MKAFCSSRCATKYAAEVIRKEKVQQVKRIKADTRARKKALDDTVPNWTKKAQKAFNAYIRERDKNLTCISCGTASPQHVGTGGLWDCGHYRSVGSCPELRFEELNAHKQCKKCNSFLSGNVVEYRINLKHRIGEEKLEWLEGPHKARRYRVEELKEIEKKYKEKLKALKNGHSNEN